MKAYKYIEWLDAEEMHEQSKEWFSELNFIKDEQKFFSSLTKSPVFKPLHQNRFEQLKKIKTALREYGELQITLVKEVRQHMNQLEVLLDDVDQLEKEKVYRKMHGSLLEKVNTYLANYRDFKKKGFGILSSILKDGKIMLLGNPQYQLKRNKTKTTT